MEKGFKIILASGSPRRKEILSKICVNFEVIKSDVDELITKEEPNDIVIELSLQKACDIAEKIEEDALIIGSDTVVACGKRILGKPKNREDAYNMISMIEGKKHQVYTGVTLIRLKKAENGSILQESRTFSEGTDVSFYPLTKEEIRSYIATGEPMDKAGAYGIQGKAAVFVKEIKGDYNNVVGLPIARLYQELKNWSGAK